MPALPRSFAATLCLLFSAWALATGPIPRDVADFIQRQDLCQHFRQEPWPEGNSTTELERRAFLTGQIERYCRNSAPALQKLKRKYRSNQAVLERLEKYRPDKE